MAWLSFLNFGGNGYEKHQEYPERITEAACDDLVQSLVRLGFIPKVIPSLDGKEYWTSEKLGQTIVSRLTKLGGRVSLLDLPRTLNIESSSVQEVIQDLLRSQPGKFIQVQDDLLEIEYLAKMTAEMNLELEQRGFLTTVEQSKNYSLGLDFMRQFLRDRVGNQIHGVWDTVDQGFVYTEWYKTQQRKALLKLLGDVKEPTTLATLRAKRVVHDQFFFGLCDALAKEAGDIFPGTIKGLHDQGTFVPRQFVRHQASSIESFFGQNGFIAYENVVKHGINDPKSYIRKLRQNALLLETHAVHESVWSIVDASVEHAITSVSWVDIKPLLPSPFTKGDLASLLAQLPSLTNPHSHFSSAEHQNSDVVTGFEGVGSPYDTFILHDRIVLTSGQIQKCLLKMDSLLENRLKTLKSWRLSFGSMGLILDNHVEDAVELGGDGRETETSTDERRKQILQVISQKGRKDRIKVVSPSSSKAKGKGSGSDLRNSRDGPSNQKKRLEEFLTLADIVAELETQEPDFEPMLTEAIARALHRPLLSQLKERNRQLIIDQVEEQADDGLSEKNVGGVTIVKQASQLLDYINQTQDKIFAYADGVKLFEDSSVMNSLSKYLLQSICSELLPLYILFASFSSLSSDQIPDSLHGRLLQQYWKSVTQATKSNGEQAAEQQQPFTIEGNDLVALKDGLQPSQAEVVKKWRKSISGSCKWKSLDELCKTLQSRPTTEFEKEQMEHDAAILSSADRKQETLKRHLKNLRITLVDVDMTISKALLVHIVTLIVFQAWTGDMLHASGKYVPKILKQLHNAVASTTEENVRDERRQHLAKLEQLMQVVIEEAKGGGNSSLATDDTATLCQSIFDYGLRLTNSQ
ncbi:E3 UFM1-protein ligase 1 [Actinomortierella wolfii]|nr:E3 UFM1-protein ligase 1 [Actinomortierella wolfii]